MWAHLQNWQHRRRRQPHLKKRLKPSLWVGRQQPAGVLLGQNWVHWAHVGEKPIGGCRDMQGFEAALHNVRLDALYSKRRLLSKSATNQVATPRPT